MSLVAKGPDCCTMVLSFCTATPGLTMQTGLVTSYSTTAGRLRTTDPTIHLHLSGPLKKHMAGK